jgi:GNAT superfamily N-acetyltransferase
MSSSPGITVRAAEQRDVPALVELLEAYMQETFTVAWRGSAEALRRDGFGREFETQVAVMGAGRVIGFAAWTQSYDLHHCLTGGDILDLYVAPGYRGRGVAPALVCTVAAEIGRRGGTYVKGQAVDNRAVQRLYARFAMCFPGADCIVGGRAFRHLATLAGRSGRGMVRSLPEKSWNYEP